MWSIKRWEGKRSIFQLKEPRRDCACCVPRRGMRSLGKWLNSGRQKLSRGLHSVERRELPRFLSDVAEEWWSFPTFSQSSPLFFGFLGRLWRTSCLWHQWPPNSGWDCELGPRMCNEKQARCLHKGLLLPRLDSSPHWRRERPSLLMTPGSWEKKQMDHSFPWFCPLRSDVLSNKCREEVRTGSALFVCAAHEGECQ